MGARGRFIGGDPLRAIAAMSVLFFHIALPVFTAPGAPPHPFGAVLDRAIPSLQLGIYVFFTLSGYLLARPFLRPGARPSLARYARARLLRIVPAFWVVTAIALVWFGARGSSAREVLAVFGFVQTYDESPFSEIMVQAWTLGAELLFYLLLPVAALLLARLRPRAIAGVLATAAVAIFLVRVLGTDATADRHIPPVMLFAFAPGIALAAIEAFRLDRVRDWSVSPAR